MAEKKADRKYPCKVVVFKNKVKCLPTVTVLLLASISPQGGHICFNGGWVGGWAVQFQGKKRLHSLACLR